MDKPTKEEEDLGLLKIIFWLLTGAVFIAGAMIAIVLTIARLVSLVKPRKRTKKGGEA